ncbi:papain-like cysteine protease family protein [Mucilaginibacter sp.]|jgi:hypothetical protein|uniref:papain-like cysteine protease family protein n=1 Tax=Mucilaginibacter sp. TaxID=1882438 RepID=UPI002BBA10A2|nr:papain-like cysteine protease family protein [Mucilaginibacter sp.]HTI58786.1 papain-like cysteine protease family protein [Mucilaginibacter sp.]
MKTSVILILSILPIFGGKINHPGISGIERHVAGLDCSQYNVYGVQHCIAGINSEILDVTASDTQHNSEWCWAASISAVFNYYGHNVSQERIVGETFGRIENVPGSPNAILSALNKNWTDDDGNDFSVRATTIAVTPAAAAQDLAADHPLIIGTLGHAMVLTALEYDHDAYGRGNVTVATVRDPWPYNARKRYLSVQEWFSTSFLARIRVY